MKDRLRQFGVLLTLFLLMLPSLKAQDEFDPFEVLRPLVNDWIVAVDQGQMDVLEEMYADEAYVYGALQSKANILASKRKFYDANPDFRQDGGDIAYIKMPYEDHFEVYFSKTTYIKGQKKDYDAVLSFEPDGKGSYLIVGETDATTERNLAKRAKAVALTESSYCLSDAGTIFNEVAIPAPYDLSFRLQLKSGKVSGTGNYYSSGMRSLYTLSIAGNTEAEGILNLQIRAEGPLYPDEPSDFMELNQKWKFTGQVWRLVGGDDLGTLEMSDDGCDE